jgi:pimeloyl-ACP methyl ester carboxylesterase
MLIRPASRRSASSQDKPTDPAEYTWKKLADDIDALLDVAVGKDEKVFIVSHDWGAFTGWRYTQWHGDRVKAFCSCVAAPATDCAMSPC